VEPTEVKLQGERRTVEELHNAVTGDEKLA
jgi:hypothetical protein